MFHDNIDEYFAHHSVAVPLSKVHVYSGMQFCERNDILNWKGMFGVLHKISVLLFYLQT